jgi:hypothetical protein
MINYLILVSYDAGKEEIFYSNNLTLTIDKLLSRKPEDCIIVHKRIITINDHLVGIEELRNEVKQLLALNSENKPLEYIQSTFPRMI